MESSSIICLFVAKNGAIAIRALEPPLEDQYEVPPVPPGMRHAVKAVGLLSTIRTYKRTADGALPVYEEE